MAEILTEHDVLGRPVVDSEVRLRMIGYRPRRRAVLRVDVGHAARPVDHALLQGAARAGVRRRGPAARAAAGRPASRRPRSPRPPSDALLLLRNLPGRPLAQAVFETDDPCTAEQLIHLLDAMPMSVSQLERRPPWSDAVQHYAQMVAAAVPSATDKLAWLTDQITTGLGPIPLGNEPTHGDFHEGQVHVADGGSSASSTSTPSGPDAAPTTWPA